MVLHGQTTAVVLKAAEYDVFNVSGLEEELSALRPGENVVDCQAVLYMDSTALSAFIRALQNLKDRNPSSRITLQHVSSGVRKLFELTCLDRVFLLQ